MPRNVYRAGMNFTVSQIAEALSARLEGDSSYLVAKPSEPSIAGPDDLALAMDKSYEDALRAGNAKAAILWSGADWKAMGLKAALFIDRPRYAMSALTDFFEIPPDTPKGIHPTALVAASACVGEGASIGPYCVIGEGVKLGQNARILAHVSIGANTQIGDNCLIYADGFSYVTPQPGAIDEVKGDGRLSKSHDTQEFARINSLGRVEIGNNVELGASSTIDRGTIADTVIGDGTKIDNLVQIGHNVRVGKTCLLCGQVGIGGSAVNYGQSGDQDGRQRKFL